MRKKITEIIKELRIEHGFTTAYVAEYIGIDEKDYIKFEACKGVSENDYLIIAGVSFLYGVTVSSIFKSAKNRNFFKDTLGECTEFEPEMQEIFQSVLGCIETVGEDEFEVIENQRGGFKFPYIAQDGKMEYLVLVENDRSDGYYFVVLDGYMKIAKYVVYDGEECFKMNDRMYPMGLSNLKVFAKIYAKFESGDV